MKPDYDPGNPDHVHHDCHRGAGCQVPGEDCQAPDVDPDDELELTGQELIADHTGNDDARALLAEMDGVRPR